MFYLFVVVVVVDVVVVVVVVVVLKYELAIKTSIRSPGLASYFLFFFAVFVIFSFRSARRSSREIGRGKQHPALCSVTGR